MIKRILIAFILLTILLVGAIVILPGLVPTDTYRAKLESQLSQTFGRDVSISGDIKLSTLPLIKVETGPVTLSNPTGFSANDFVNIQGMSAKVKLWPLLSKQVEISGISLDAPVIRLEKKANGEVNWTLNDAADQAPAPQETGPFKRDGRFTDYTPSLALLQISDGKVIYADASSGQNITLEKINLDLNAPNLRSPLKLKGDFLIDGLATNFDGVLASPFDFLSGDETSFDAKVDTGEGSFEAVGEFLKSEDILFNARFSSSSDAPLSLAKRLPLPENITIPPLTGLTAKGDVTYGPNMTTLPKLEVAAVGQGLDVSFNGSADASGELNASGDFSARLDDMSVLNPYLEEPIEALNLVETVEANGTLNLQGSDIDITGLSSQLSGPQVNAKFNGAASFDDALTLSGSFSGETPDFAALVETAGLSQPDAAALKRVSATGNVNLANAIVTLTDLTASAADGLVNGDFAGKISYADRVNIEGRFKGNISDLGALDAALPRDIPYSEVAKRITLSTEIGTLPSGYKLTDLTAALEDGLVNGDFNGQLAIGETSDISGTLSLAADSLRTIATTQNVDVPPSTPVGPIFEAFQLTGQVSGTADTINFNNGSLALDDISTSGDFVLHMTEAKPRLTGKLILNPLDLRPYMAAWSEQKPEGVILPWSTTPINLGGLEAVDAEIDLDVPSIVMDRLKLGETELRASVKNGMFSTNITKAELYDGLVDGSFSLTSANGVPKISIKADVNAVAAQTFLSASSGFDKVAGTANLSLSLEGQGVSQEAIMKSLTGSGNFKILDGQLLGIDASTLISGIDEAITSRQLPQGIGLGKVTKFNDLIGSFSITNGRANLGDFKLQSGDLYMDAQGLIDIGAQKIDFGIRPKLAAGSDLAQFGIPLKFSGGFGTAKAGLDTDMLAQIAAARARQSAGDLVKDQIGGTLGDILGGVIGGTPETSSTETEAPQPDDTPAKNPTSRITDAVGLPNIAGDGTTPQTDEATLEESPSSATETKAEETIPPREAKEDAADQAPEGKAADQPEELIENALKDLFGRKKKTDSNE